MTSTSSSPFVPSSFSSLAPFEVDLPPGSNGVSVLDLGCVVYKDTHVLKKIRIRSNEPTKPQLIRILHQNDLLLSQQPQLLLEQQRQMVGFQLQNENVGDLKGLGNDTILQNDDFNQIFDDVDLIESFTLLPNSTQDLLVSFRPSLAFPGEGQDEDEYNSQMMNENGDSDSDEDEGEEQQEREREKELERGREKRTRDKHHQHQEEQGKRSSSSSTTRGGARRRNAFRTIQGVITLQLISPLTKEEGKEEGEDKEKKKQKSLTTSKVEVVEFEKKVLFVVRICRSVLQVDVRELVFESCVLGSTYIKDFAVWNRSEMPLSYSLSCKQTKHNTNVPSSSSSTTPSSVPSPASLTTTPMLEFLDYETGLPLEGNGELSSYSHQTVRVGFCPRFSGEYLYAIRVKNLIDPNNVQFIQVHCFVVTPEGKKVLPFPSSLSLLRLFC
jgi:hypothetical protein